MCFEKLGLKPCFSINERRRTRADARTAVTHFTDFCLTLMHLLGANFCMRYLFPFSKLRLNVKPVIIFVWLLFNELRAPCYALTRALIFGQHGQLDSFRTVNKYFKQRGFRPRQTRNTVNNKLSPVSVSFYCFIVLFRLSLEFQLVLKICCNFI